MRATREKIAWGIAGALALGVAAAVATAVSGGSLDPPGPPSDTGPLEAVMIPPQARLIQIADDVLVSTSAALPATATSTPSTPTNTAIPPTDTPQPIGQVDLISFRSHSQRPVPRLLGTQNEVTVDCGACTFASGTASVTVDVEFTNNSGASITLGALNFNLLGNNQSSLNPTAGACAAPGTACNPNLILADGGWTCGPPNPVADGDASGTATDSFISCFNGGGTGETVANGATITLAQVTFTGGTDGVTNLTLSAVNVADSLGVEVHACAPGPDPCNNAVVQIGESPATSTPSTTPTITPTGTPTATPCGALCPTSTSLSFITVTPTPPVSPPPASSVYLGHHDVRDCAEIAVFVEVRAASGQPGSSSLQLHAQLSAMNTGNFGVLRFDGNASSWTIPVSSQVTTQTQRATLFGQVGQDAPFVAIYAGQGAGGNVDLVLDAWLYCIPRT